MNIISSQTYLDSAIVADKLANKDFIVKISPAFSFDDKELAVVLDGHHSLAAAQEAGVEAVYEVQDVSDLDTLALLGDSVEDFLEAVWVDSDWYYVDTKENVW